MKKTRLIIGFGMLALLIGGAVQAEGSGKDGKGGVCKEDRQKFCPDKKGKDAWKCMSEHESELSQACKDKRAERKAKRDELESACSGDIQKYCSEGKRKLKCLRENRDKLTSECGSKVDDVKFKKRKKS